MMHFVLNFQELPDVQLLKVDGRILRRPSKDAQTSTKSSGARRYLNGICSLLRPTKDFSENIDLGSNSVYCYVFRMNFAVTKKRCSMLSRQPTERLRQGGRTASYREGQWGFILKRKERKSRAPALQCLKLEGWIDGGIQPLLYIVDSGTRQPQQNPHQRRARHRHAVKE
jgi:hypothetical protein